MIATNWIWDHTFLDEPKNPKNYVCLIVLNQKIAPSLFKWMYALSDFTIFADGGSDIVKGMLMDEGELYDCTSDW